MYNLLIADDEPEIRNSLSSYFPWNETGFEVVGLAENGKKALELIDRLPVDALLCDIRMPVRSGIDVARELHERGHPAKIVFLSGYRDFEYAKQAILYGVKNYIVKPTKYYELVDVFRRLKAEMDRERAAAAGTADRPVPPAEPQEGTAEKVIAAIKKYVEEKYTEATLESAAETVHMNPYYVSKFFKQKTGENFSDYVMGVRMRKAAELLQDFRYKVYEVGGMVGYTSAKHFARTFKKHFGKSPFQYRNPE